MIRRLISVALLVSVFSFPAMAQTPTPTPTTSSHAIVRFFQALINPATLKVVASKVVFATEAGVDVVHGVTYVTDTAVSKVDLALEKVQAKLGGSAN